MAKVKFKCAPDVNVVEVAVGDHLVRVEKGSPIETSDQHEIAALQAHEGVVEAKGKGDDE